MVFLMLACSPDTNDEVAPLVASDVETTARVLEDVGLQPTTVADCVDTVGDCRLCYDATGTPLAGTLAVELETAACGGTLEGAGESLELTIQSSTFAGGWTSDASGILVELAGERTSTFTGSRGRLDNALTVTTVDAAELQLDLAGEVTYFSILATYAGLAGRTYTLEASEDAGALSGTVTSPGGSSCTLTGTREAPVVDCTR